MAAGTLLSLLYVVLDPTRPVAAILYSVIGVAAVAGTVAGVRHHRPPNARAWYVFATGELLWVFGDAVYAINGIVFHQEPYPSVADAFYLAAYPSLVGGLLLLSRTGRGRARDLGGLIDATIVAAGLGLVYWLYVLRPIVADTSTPPLTHAITTAYPIMDLMLFAVIARQLTRTGARTTSMWLLIAGSALVVVSDVCYTYLAAFAGDGYLGGLATLGYLVGYVCWSGAALHPSSAAPAPASTTDRLGRARLGVLTVAIMVAPGMLIAEGLTGQDHVDWLAIGVAAVVLFALVLLRLSGFVRQVQSQARQLGDLAMRDELTGLANRRRFEEAMRDALAAGNPQVALLDLTDFKNVNDRHGHVVGDQLLAAVARRLAEHLREDDVVARMGGDEFAVLVPDAPPAAARSIMERLGSALRAPFSVGGVDLLVTASIGFADADGTDDPVEMLRRADVAMYAAKDNPGKARRYTPDLDVIAGEQARLGAELRTALDTGQFRVVYQPIVELPGNEIVAVEALVRWEHPERGLVSPADFIPVAEDNGLIVELGAWILRTACAQQVAWRDELGAAAPRRVSVNVSARQLAEPGFAELVESVLTGTGLPAAMLVAEVTETAVFGGGRAAQSLRDLDALGVRIALDDFGTGHSSLGLLQTVPVHVLKVDKSFVDNITMAGRHAVIATALIQVSEGLGLAAVAEGVETAEQAAELHRMGYRWAQGYYFGRPVPPADIAEALRCSGGARSGLSTTVGGLLDQ
jgi:diguanylate cyclase